jgi:hypothetical protein
LNFSKKKKKKKKVFLIHEFEGENKNADGWLLSTDHLEWLRDRVSFISLDGMLGGLAERGKPEVEVVVVLAVAVDLEVAVAVAVLVTLDVAVAVLATLAVQTYGYINHEILIIQKSL